MNSGKSTLLLQVAYNYEERGQRVVLVKPVSDTRSAGVFSRLGAQRLADIVSNDSTNLIYAITQLEADGAVACILVDEAQFLAPEQVDQLFYLAVVRNIPVLAYGLRSDFATKGFPGSIRLMEVAHAMEELKTICRCGSKAIFNGRKVAGEWTNTGSQVAIEGEVEYESLCGRCYENVLPTFGGRRTQ